jgi:hypothetical protein
VVLLADQIRAPASRRAHLSYHLCVAAFADRLKDAVDLAFVRDDLVGVVHQTRP